MCDSEPLWRRLDPSLASATGQLERGHDAAHRGADAYDTTIVRQFPFADSWLTAKVLLLMLYVAAGVVELGPRRPHAIRFLVWAAATTLFAFIVTIARARHPLGVLAALPGTR